MATPAKAIRISSSALDQLPITGFKPARYRFLDSNTDKTRTEFMHYKLPKLKGEWPNKFVEYYYRHPETNAWQRFRVYEEINRNKSEKYDKLLLNAVTASLKEGWSPFGIEKEEQKPYTIQRALHYFLLKWQERGQEAQTIIRYERAIGYFEQWLLMKGLQFLPAAEITQDHIESALQHWKIKRGWSNRTYNNTLDFLSTCFLYLSKKNIIT